MTKVAAGFYYRGAAIAIALTCLHPIGSSVDARDLGQYAQADPKTRQWFRQQISPKTGGSCCNEADGIYAEEDIRNGHYWTRWEGSGGWQQVPDDVVINDPNRNGAPVVWWYVESFTD